jgi:hypothetical protein
MRAWVRDSWSLLAAGVFAGGCAAAGAAERGPIGELDVIRSFPTHAHPAHELADCMYASPLAIESRGEDFVLAAAGDTIAALDPDTGALRWQVKLDSPAGRTAWIVATPVLVGDQLVVAFQRTPGGERARLSHHVAVVDLKKRALDADFPELELTASMPAFDRDADVAFSPANALSRAALAHADVPDRDLGLVYVAFGNARDVQPWHGWVFEVDLDAWRDEGTQHALSGVLLTTPETDCGTPGMSGSRDMLCGAGVWSPAGPKVFQTSDGYELLIPTGNGALDPTRGDYAHTLMRAGRGLRFDPHCDMSACDDFDAMDPQKSCVESCRDLFVPRLMPDDPPLRPESGVCDGMTMFECYARLDWDLGADSPARVELPRAGAVYVMPAKDGGVYLIDATHMGRLLDRKQVAPICGTKDDPCTTDWAGMIVTEPVIVPQPEGPLALVPTFMFDHTQPAGVVALRIEDATDGAHGPSLVPVWQAPDAADPLAVELFRQHSTRLSLQDLGGETYGWIASVKSDGPGTLLAIRTRDGAIAARVKLQGHGQRYVKPLVWHDRVYLSSCDSDEGPSRLEAYAITPAAP